jgi:hypothetical protein
MRMSTGGTQHPSVQSSAIAFEGLLNHCFHCIEPRRTEISAVRFGHDAATRDVLQTRIELEHPKADSREHPLSLQCCRNFVKSFAVRNGLELYVLLTP